MATTRSHSRILQRAKGGPYMSEMCAKTGKREDTDAGTDWLRLRKRLVKFGDSAFAERGRGRWLVQSELVPPKPNSRYHVA